MVDFSKEIAEYFSKVSSAIAKLNIDSINVAVNGVLNTYMENGNIYIFGNGGSAATASHFVCDFNKGVCENKEKKFNFICLSDNTPIITAIANDIGYEDVFLYQLQNKLKSQDLIIAISGSGNSKNVIKAVEYAKICKVKCIGITGFNGGRLKEISDYSMHVDIEDMQIAEDLHMIFDHMMMKVLSVAI